jgi:hypothetical protein
MFGTRVAIVDAWRKRPEELDSLAIAALWPIGSPAGGLAVPEIEDCRENRETDVREPDT